MNDARLVASRYAQALSDAVSDDAVFGRVRDELRQLAGLVKESAELRHALANPVTPADAKGRVMRAIAERMEAHPRTISFLETLATHDRLPMLADAAIAVEAAHDARLGVHEVSITSASTLGPEVRQRLEGALGELAGGKIRVSETVDPELLGGVVARVGSTVYDGSVKTRLQALRTKLVGGASGSK